MQQNQIRALIKLISTEEEQSRELKKELAGIISSQPSALKHVLKEDYKNEIPAFVNSLIEEVAWERLKNSFKTFSNKINPDLEEGLLLISQFESLSAQKESFNEKLDKLVKNARRYIINCVDTLEVAQMLRVYLFDDLKITTISDFTQSKHLSFDKLLDNKEGSGLCVACLYYMIGIRYGIEINIVNVAGHILVKFEDKNFAAPFYIDPFDKGKILTQKECVDFVSARGMDWSARYEAPMSSRMIIKRLLSNMIFILNKIKDERKLGFLRSYFSNFEQF